MSILYLFCIFFSFMFSPSINISVVLNIVAHFEANNSLAPFTHAHISHMPSENKKSYDACLSCFSASVIQPQIGRRSFAQDAGWSCSWSAVHRRLRVDGPPCGRAVRTRVCVLTNSRGVSPRSHENRCSNAASFWSKGRSNENPNRRYHWVVLTSLPLITSAAKISLHTKIAAYKAEILVEKPTLSTEDKSTAEKNPRY